MYNRQFDTDSIGNTVDNSSEASDSIADDTDVTSDATGVTSSTTNRIIDYKRQVTDHYSGNHTSEEDHYYKTQAKPLKDFQQQHKTPEKSNAHIVSL